MGCRGPCADRCPRTLPTLKDGGCRAQDGTVQHRLVGPFQSMFANPRVRAFLLLAFVQDGKLMSGPPLWAPSSFIGTHAIRMPRRAVGLTAVRLFLGLLQLCHGASCDPADARPPAQRAVDDLETCRRLYVGVTSRHLRAPCSAQDLRTGCVGGGDCVGERDQGAFSPQLMRGTSGAWGKTVPMEFLFEVSARGRRPRRPTSSWCLLALDPPVARALSPYSLNTVG